MNDKKPLPGSLAEQIAKLLIEAEANPVSAEHVASWQEAMEQREDAARKMGTELEKILTTGERGDSLLHTIADSVRASETPDPAISAILKVTDPWAARARAAEELQKGVSAELRKRGRADLAKKNNGPERS